MKKTYIWIIVGCCVLLLLLGIVGGIAAYYTISSTNTIIDTIEQEKNDKTEEKEESKKITKDETKTETDLEDELIEYHNQAYPLRNDIYYALLDINEILIDPPSANAIKQAIDDAESAMNDYENFVMDNPTNSDQMNQLEEDYLYACQDVYGYSQDLYTNFDDIETYNDILNDYNDAFDRVENSFQAIIDFMDEFSVLIEE